MHKQTSNIPPSLLRREFLKSSVVLAAAGLAPLGRAASNCEADALPEAFSSLKPLGSRVHPITTEEYRGRLEHAQKLMTDLDPKYQALFVAPGTSLYYFTGIRWSMSERLLAFLLPRTGEPIIVVPAFEESRMREKLQFPAEVHIWQEDQSPTKIAAEALADRGIRAGRIGVEETVPFTFLEHLRAAAPGLEYVSADPVTIACRGRKSPHELELMRLACEATFDVFRAVFAYVFITFLMRVLGRRELSSLAPSDLILLVVLGDLIQNGVTQSDYSMTGVVLATSTIGLCAVGTSLLVYRSKRLSKIIEGDPLIIVQDGKPIENNMKSERVKLDDVMEEAREQQIENLDEVKWAVLEPTGKITFIKK